MKKSHFKRGFSQIVAGIVFSLLPLGAMAFNFKPDTFRVVSDPAYLPLGGQLFGSSEYTYAMTGSNTDNSLGNLKSANQTLSNTITQLWEFGLTSDFTLRASDSYVGSTSTTSPPNGTQTTTHSEGFNDPTFSVIWRALDQQDHPLNWDFQAAYAPNLFNAQSADASESGTVARGGDTEAFGTALSQQTTD